MTKKYEIILKYIKDLSVEIPNAETFIFSRENITKYTLGLNIKTNPIKDQTIEVITNLNYKDKNLINELADNLKIRQNIVNASTQENFKEILEKLLKLIEKKRILIPIPIIFANIIAFFFQILPKPLITRDQIRLLNFDNIPSGKYKTNFDIDLKTELKFESEVEKYCYMWKESGEYSKKTNLN